MYGCGRAPRCQQRSERRCVSTQRHTTASVWKHSVAGRNQRSWGCGTFFDNIGRGCCACSAACGGGGDGHNRLAKQQKDHRTLVDQPEPQFVGARRRNRVEKARQQFGQCDCRAHPIGRACPGKRQQRELPGRERRHDTRDVCLVDWWRWVRLRKV